MAHSRLTRGLMFDWIERCLDEGAPTPTDAAIMDRFGFESPESARTLLSDIADAGLITIKGYGATRTIALGRARGAFTPASRPMPSVVTRDNSVDKAVDKVMAIVRRAPVAKAAPARLFNDIAATAAPSPTISKSPARPSQAGARSDGERPGVIPAPVAVAPHKVSAAARHDTPSGVTATPGQEQMAEGERTSGDPARADSAPPPVAKRLSPRPNALATREERRQLNIHFPAADFDRIAARATAAGQTTPHYARAAVIASLDKPTIPAAVTAAAIRHGTPLCDFVRMLLAVGLAAFEHDLAPEIVA